MNCIHIFSYKLLASVHSPAEMLGKINTIATTVSHVIPPYLYPHFKVLEHKKKTPAVCTGASVLLYSAAFLSGLTCRRTEDGEADTAEMNIKAGASDWTVHFPLLTLHSLAHHFSVTLLKGWCLCL